MRVQVMLAAVLSASVVLICPAGAVDKTGVAATGKATAGRTKGAVGQQAGEAAGAVALTSAECKNGGGKVQTGVDPRLCWSGIMCSVTDQWGTKRNVCIKDVISDD